MLNKKSSWDSVINDVLCRDLGMFVYFIICIIMLTYICSELMQQFWKPEKVTVFSYPPYFPDLIPYDFPFSKTSKILTWSSLRPDKPLTHTAISQCLRGLHKSTFLSKMDSDIEILYFKPRRILWMDVICSLNYLSR